jgi:hypothetical protein
MYPDSKNPAPCQRGTFGGDSAVSRNDGEITPVIDGRQALGGNRLVVLAGQIKLAHANAESAVQHGIRAGEALIEAKSLLDHGAWLPWLAANVGFSERTAQAYMRVARLSKSATVADLRIGGRRSTRLAPLAGHVRIGLGAGIEVWIAPSLQHLGFVYITVITPEDAVGLSRPVAMSALDTMLQVMGVSTSSLKWRDEIYPPWTMNILLFDSADAYVDRCKVDELREIVWQTCDGFYFKGVALNGYTAPIADLVFGGGNG